MRKNISLLIKPSSSNCNLGCKYCGSKRAEECDSCTYYQLCRSGCRRHKEMFADTHAKSDQDLHDNYFCESYKIFFHHSSDKLKQIAQFVRSRQGI